MYRIVLGFIYKINWMDNKIAVTMGDICIHAFHCLCAVFTEKDLELDPLYKVPPHEAFLASHPGTVDFAAASGSHKALYEESMARICARVKQYRILLKPVFQDFDRYFIT